MVCLHTRGLRGAHATRAVRCARGTGTLQSIDAVRKLYEKFVYSAEESKILRQARGKRELSCPAALNSYRDRLLPLYSLGEKLFAPPPPVGRCGSCRIPLCPSMAPFLALFGPS